MSRGRVIQVDRAAPLSWPEAEIVGRPRTRGKGKDGWAGEPVTLVRRKVTRLDGPGGSDVFYVPGAGTVISLFTGAGGMDLGLEAAGFVTVVQNEWDGFCCETLIHNRPRYFRRAALVQSDLRLTPTSLLLGEAGLRVGEATLVVGGPPCQGFSISGKRRPDDARNDLVFQFLRVVDEARPAHFIMENVPGFLNFNKGAYFEAFLREAYGCYYELVYGLVNAVEYGVPQDRTRFICSGTRRDLFEIEGRLASLPKPHTFSTPDLDRIEMFGRLPLWQPELELLTGAPGIRYFPDRPVLVPPAPCRGHGEGLGRSKAFLEFYRRLRREEPDRLVDAPTADGAGAAQSAAQLGTR